MQKVQNKTDRDGNGAQMRHKEIGKIFTIPKPINSKALGDKFYVDKNGLH